MVDHLTQPDTNSPLEYLRTPDNMQLQLFFALFSVLSAGVLAAPLAVPADIDNVLIPIQADGGVDYS
ncbi:uncharacterized protein CC84DRAFT_912307 [Paraphaeosphaeria sporulosa]|uniref:Uncharacterized protein n=1 Tax=Paraphaeosphaeria sporulosa TaxID=1460663 RepID=A0A177C5F6_9PLEO|nr:uncharacterized protein CC84DRAFT_912307 [Paraphaeosphaeria sporulosa]OAG02745.1 hypothetical protein CC84DRAFT_912307 [Paraphaeosphaeria sporulosa]